MKKLTALLLAALLALSAAACAQKPADTTLGDSTTAPTEETTTAPTSESTTEATQPESKFDMELCQPFFGSWTLTVTLDGSLLNMTEL